MFYVEFKKIQKSRPIWRPIFSGGRVRNGHMSREKTFSSLRFSACINVTFFCLNIFGYMSHSVSRLKEKKKCHVFFGLFFAQKVLILLEIKYLFLKTAMCAVYLYKFVY